MARRARGQGSWRQLLVACQREGRLEVIRRLEAVHQVYERWEATAWGEPEQHARARRLRQICLRQDETLITLRQLTDEDIAQALETGVVRVSGVDPGGGQQ